MSIDNAAAVEKALSAAAALIENAPVTQEKAATGLKAWMGSNDEKYVSVKKKTLLQKAANDPVVARRQ